MEKKHHTRAGEGTKLLGDSRAKGMLPTQIQGPQLGIFTSLLSPRRCSVSTLEFPGAGRSWQLSDADPSFLPGDKAASMVQLVLP